MKNFAKILTEISQGNIKVLRKELGHIAHLDAKETQEIWSTYLSLKRRPKIVGLLGTPGSGKSTFLNLLLSQKPPGTRVALLLIDPSNPLTGGALLGDRIRLSEHFLSPEIFMRSISNQGSDDGLNPNLSLYLLMLSCFPFDLIIVEAVGGGQASTSLKDFVEETVLIHDPHSGDTIQHLKNGVFDIADDIIISKADLVNVTPIVQSLHDWLGNNVNLWPANLLKKNELQEFFKTRVFIPSDKNAHVMKAFLKRQQLEKLKALLDTFNEQYFGSRKITKEKVQQFQEHFKDFFQKNY